MMASQYTEGLDDSKPIGIVVRSVDGEIRPLGILPVDDLPTFLEGMESQLGEPEDAGNGIVELAGPVPIYVKEKDGWAFIAQSTDDLDSTPADPASLFEGADKKYDVSVMAHVQNIPKEYRDMALNQIREGVEIGLEELDEEDVDAETQRKIIANSIRQWEDLLDGMDTLTFGWLTDSDSRKVLANMTMTAVDGTKFDERMKLMQSAKSRFTGFAMDSAAVSMNAAGQMLPDDIQSTMEMVEPLREQMDEEIEGSDEIEPDAKPVVKRLANSFMDILLDTVKSGKFDMGMSMMVDDDGMNVIAGAHVADGGKLESNIKEIASLISNEKPDVKLELNVDQHAGVRFHKLSVKVPEDEEDAIKVLGPTLDVAIGISKESAYMAIGKKGMELVRQGIDKSGSQETSVRPATMKIALAPIMKFAASLDDDDVLSAVAAALEKTADDLIMAKVEAIEDGAVYEFEVREGVLNAIGEGIQASQKDEIE